MGKFVKVGDMVINKDAIVSVGEVYCKARDIYHSSVLADEHTMKIIRRSRSDRSLLEFFLDFAESELSDTLGYSLREDVPAYFTVKTTTEDNIVVDFNDVEDAIRDRNKLVKELLDEED